MSLAVRIEKQGKGKLRQLRRKQVMSWWRGEGQNARVTATLTEAVRVSGELNGGT